MMCFILLIHLFSIGCRYDDEQGDYDEGNALQFAEQEEEDLNRIKEESRRRRQAILEKYKSQRLQQQNEPPSVEIEKGKFELHFRDILTTQCYICLV